MKRYVHTRTDISLVTTANSFLIHPRSSTRSRGNGGTKTSSFIKPHKKMSHSVISGDALTSRPDRPIQCCGRYSFRYLLTSLCE
ncbi:hypothetical protein TNIN_376751 [Trichonephila inaurata madagascariensis]|uniref:Uncharacterized protein n=1 Tax=Trichonephila inaurata madagascariensis TaxID=2747483 RepID=A0A8X6YKF7_9ARAC|nr:hypothetical protein TNIN_376751 [Trichonephila inaurata madagascariensis]